MSKDKGETRELFEWAKVIDLKDLPDTNGDYFTMVKNGEGVYKSITLFRNGEFEMANVGGYVLEWLKPIQSSLKEGTDVEDILEFTDCSTVSEFKKEWNKLQLSLTPKSIK